MTEEQSNDTAYEEAVDKATKLGWVPKDQYKGNQDNWRDAPEFLEFGERLNPILRENNKRLEAQLKERDAQIAEIRKQVSEFAKVHEETKKQAYAEALVALKLEKKTALEEGNYDAVIEIDEKIAATREAEKTVPVETKQDTSFEIPVDIQNAYGTWLEANPWADMRSEKYDEDMEAYAVEIGNRMIKQHGQPTSAEGFSNHLKRVEEKVRKAFESKFENTNRTRQSSVEGGGTVSGSSKGKGTYGALPKEAQEACDFLISTGAIKNREEYLKTYRWDK